MFRFILICLLFIASLVNFFPVPAKEVWYAGIAISEFPWIFIGVCLLLLLWNRYAKKMKRPGFFLGLITLFILCSPIIRAYLIGSKLNNRLEAAFGPKVNSMTGFHQANPFSFFRMFTGTGAKGIPFKTFTYATHTGVELTLNFSSSAVAGIRPCLLEVHGGSWKRGDNSEIAHFNNYIANAGYHVATINYRLAPTFHSPAQAEDIHAALVWLKEHAAELKIDTTSFVLSGRSAGAQLVLATAYDKNETGIKGVIPFYGPTDMFWTYDHPDNKLIMDSREVQRDFLGGTPQQVPGRYDAESPLLHADAGSVPTLLVHGGNDAHVYFEQSVRMHNKLDSLKVPNMLLGLPWATHGCEFNLAGPSGQLSLYSVERFMKAVTGY